MKGCTVEVVRGRKVPIGTIGVVIWEGEGRSYAPAPRYRGGWYSPPAPPMRIGVKDSAGTVHWTAASNVEVRKRPEPLPEVAFVPAAGYSKGTKVETAEGPGRIFWVGPDKRNPGGTRLGVKLAGSGATLWASTTEVALEGEVLAEEHEERAAMMAEAEEGRAAEAEAPAHEPGPSPLPTTGAAMAWAAAPTTAGKAAA